MWSFGSVPRRASFCDAKPPKPEPEFEIPELKFFTIVSGFEALPKREKLTGTKRGVTCSLEF